MFFLFFFFKQKTAYEMRISDWSSDVCSSDLLANAPDADPMRDGVVLILRELGRVAENNGLVEIAPGPGDAFNPDHHQAMSVIEADGIAPHAVAQVFQKGRSEEHTSELQSLMRISYAVFCLKHKKNTTLKQRH